MVKAYQKAHVTMIGDDRALAYEKGMIPATDEDWATEYNDLRPVSYTHLDVYKRQLYPSSLYLRTHWYKRL